MYRSIQVLVMLSLSMTGMSQGFAGFMEAASENHPGIVAASELMNWEVADSRKGLAPPDPKVNLGFFPGRPDVIGNKTTWSVEQEFDFPTRYARLKQLKETNMELAKLDYDLTVTELLSQTRKMAIELVARRNMLREYTVREESMKRLEDYYRVMVERGESTMLEFNKVKLKRGEIGAVISRLEREINELKMTLDYLSGGNAGLLDNAIYPGFHAPDRDSILAVRKSIHPAFLIPGKRSEAAERTIGVEKSGNLPSIGIGYASEAVAGEQFIGPTLGMTVPLWNNRGKVNAARAKHSYMQVNASGQSEYLEMEFNRTFDSWEAVKENMNIVVSVIGDSDNSLLLEKALKLGEISLIDYIVELSAIFNMVDQYHELQREYALLLSSIYEHDLVPGY